MREHLSLVRGDARAASFEPEPYRLGERSQRPGELADVLRIELTPERRAHSEALATRARLPLELAVVIAVEAERALQEVASALAIDPTDIAADLDAVAASSVAAEFDPVPTRPLRAYASALRSGGYRPVRKQRLELVVPDRLHASWSLAATNARVPLDEWVAARLAAATSTRERWEAQAANEGQTLAEWVSLQALRRARRSSSSAQPTASA